MSDATREAPEEDAACTHTQPGPLAKLVAELREIWPQTDWAKMRDPMGEVLAVRGSGKAARKKRQQERQRARRLGGLP